MLSYLLQMPVDLHNNLVRSNVRLEKPIVSSAKLSPPYFTGLFFLEIILFLLVQRDCPSPSGPLLPPQTTDDEREPRISADAISISVFSVT